MTAVLSFGEQWEIPLSIGTLAEFRRWALSDECPQGPRFDYVAGRIEVEMSPEDFYAHGTLKSEIVAVLRLHAKLHDLGDVVTSNTRVSSPAGDVSAEPDVVFISHEARRTGRVRLVPKSTGQPGHFVEVEGAADLIVEIVSDSSVSKDNRRLPPAYFAAGVREYWLADARREPVAFRIHRRGQRGFEPVESDAEGYQCSDVLGRRFRLHATRDGEGLWRFDLQHEAAARRAR